MQRRRIHPGTIAIVLFVILDIFLVGLAEKHASHPSSAADSAPIRPFHVTTTTGIVPGASTSATPASVTPSPTPSTVTKPPAAALLLSASSAQVAISARAGCQTKPHLALTTNGGITFSPVKAPAPHVLRVSSVSATEDWIVGANAACTPTYFSTSNSGKTWTSSSTLGRVWVALPAGVNTPSNGLAKPCGVKSPKPLALAPSGFTAAIVVCRNGVHATTNGGTSWRKTAALPAGQPFAAALTTDGKGVLLLASAGTCSGVRVALTTDSGAKWTRGQCLSGATIPAGVTLTSAGAGLVSDPGTSYSSTDFGKTWM